MRSVRSARRVKKMLRYLILIFPIILVSCLSTPEKEYDRANKMRKTIDKYQLNTYAEEEYKVAEENYVEAKTLLDEKKNFKAKKVLSVVNNNYQKVLDKGFPPYTDERDEETKKEKDTALEIKANVAVKEQYQSADDVYNEAVSFKDAKEYENAIDKYSDAKTKFNDAYSQAHQKRDRAEDSIDKTENYKAELEKNAQNLEERIQSIKDELAEEGN